jgi:hypothetical protein
MAYEEKNPDLGLKGPTFNPRRGDYNDNKITSTIIGKHNPRGNPESNTIAVCSVPMTTDQEGTIGSNIDL